MEQGEEAILITGARRLLPGEGFGGEEPLFLRGGRIEPVPARLPRKVLVVDARGLAAAPALLDLHVHLREPGMEEAETIATGTQAAAAGGFGGVVAMPNTRPPMDRPERIRWLRDRAARTGVVTVWPVGCLTRERAGREPVVVEELAASGAVGFSDDGTTVADDGLMEEIMQRVREVGSRVLDHAQREVKGSGVVHAGEVARRLGLPGIPAEAETEVIACRLEQCRRTGCRLHIQHVSTAVGAQMIARARREGLPVSGEVTPHHLALCERDIREPDPDFKMNPPLRTEEDRAALVEAVQAGTLECLATDHAPHTDRAKRRGFREAPFGVVGLETAVGVTFTELVVKRGMAVGEWLARWVSGPRSVLGLPVPRLTEGEAADVVLLDLEREWVVRKAEFRSRGRNTPFEGWKLVGRAMMTVTGGRVSWRHPWLVEAGRWRRYGQGAVLR